MKKIKWYFSYSIQWRCRKRVRRCRKKLSYV